MLVLLGSEEKMLYRKEKIQSKEVNENVPSISTKDLERKVARIIASITHTYPRMHNK